MIVETKDLVKHFNKTTALNGLNLAVKTGSLFAFLGPNGAGKTTAIRILNGLTSMTSGNAAIAGVDITRHSAAIKQLCGLVSQNINLDGELTVAENLDFHGRLYAMSRPVRQSRTRDVLEYVDMAELARTRVKTLSGGYKRRLLIARALMHEPKLLFLDEPTAGLDPAIRRRVWNLIKRVSHDGVTIFLTTHYIEEAEFLADRVGFLHQGRLAAEGDPAAMMAALGEWAVDRYTDGETNTRYFPDRPNADNWLRQTGGEVTLRRVNLEDVYLRHTGKRVR